MGILLREFSERNGDGFGRSWLSSRDVEDRYDYGRDRCDRSGSQESVSNDVLHLLLSDPFGMDISSTFMAITGCLEDFWADYGGYGGNEVGTSNGSYQLFTGLNFIWNNALKYQSFSRNIGFDYMFLLVWMLRKWNKREENLEFLIFWATMFLGERTWRTIIFD